VTGTGRRKGRKRTEKDGNTYRYTVVTGTERRKGWRRAEQDGNTDRYKVVTGTERRREGNGQEKMETQTGIQ
jgi:hypothetical protein